MSKIDEFILTVQKDICKIKKDKLNEYHKSKYADLEAVLNVLNPYFNEAGVLVKQIPVQQGSNNDWYLETTFKIDDEKQSWLFPLMMPESKNPMQAIGSAMTYARRYQFKGLFKLVDSDDDANTVNPTGQSEKKAGKAAIEKTTRAFASLMVTKEDIENRYKTNIDELTFGELDDLRNIYKLIKNGTKSKDEFFDKDIEWQD